MAWHRQKTRSDVSFEVLRQIGEISQSHSVGSSGEVTWLRRNAGNSSRERFQSPSAKELLEAGCDRGRSKQIYAESTV